MMYDIFYLSDSNDTGAWKDFKKKYPTAQKLENIDSLDQIKKKSFTKFFWVVWDNLDISKDFTFDYRVSEWDEEYIHVFKNGEYFDGVCLFSKTHNVSNREFKYRFFENKKEIDIKASEPKPFEQFSISDYQEYLVCLEKTTTDMFWVVWNDVTLVRELDYQVPYYNQNLTHVFKNGEHFDGVCLFSKTKPVSEKEFNYRSFLDKKEIDLEFSKPKPFEQFNISDYREYLVCLEKATTNMFWVVWNDVELISELDYQIPYYNQHITHVFKNGEYFDGVCLFSKNKIVSEKEFNYRSFLDKKEIDLMLSLPRSFEKFKIDTYQEYLVCLEKTTTNMFWVIWNDVELISELDYQVPYYNQHITHVFKNNEYFDGVCLFSKIKKITEKEFKHRFFVEKKEIEIQMSSPKKYDQFIIDTYEDYLSALKKSTTEMLWLIPKEVEPYNFNFDLYFSHHNSYDRNMNHVFHHKFKDELNFNGISLVSKNKIQTKKEIDYRFPIDKKMYDIVASRHRPYDIIFISYNEPNADENFEKLKNKFTRVKRIHGIKGIHNAHRKAAEIADTDMFFVVDGDAEVLETFEFDHLVTRYERDIVYIWKSQNPINDLVYGYGGVKLLPKDLVLSMNMMSVDMTTSISDRMKVMDAVSNVTRFDVDEFSTWKSAFRECVKLASKPVDEKYDEETDSRLHDWCTKGNDRKFGIFAIDGAKAGRDYGFDNIDNVEALGKINDFDFLKELYEQRTKNIHP